MTIEEQIARLARGWFREQRRLWVRDDKTRFGDMTFAMADGLEELLVKAFLKGARRAKGSKRDVPELAAAARQRALQTAREVNATTKEWLDQGRDPWTAERAASIGITEARFATEQSFSLVVKERGGKVRWKTDADPCKLCRKLNGKTVKAGQPFTTVDGQPIYHPPRHPHCFCVVEAV